MQYTPGDISSLAAAVAVILGPFFPVATTLSGLGSSSVNGVEVSGGLALLVSLVGLSQFSAVLLRLGWRAELAPAAIAIAIGVGFALQVAPSVESIIGTVSLIGTGVWMVIGGGVVGTINGINRMFMSAWYRAQYARVHVAVRVLIGMLALVAMVSGAWDFPAYRLIEGWHGVWWVVLGVGIMALAIVIGEASIALIAAAAAFAGIGIGVAAYIEWLDRAEPLYMGTIGWPTLVGTAAFGVIALIATWLAIRRDPFPVSDPGESGL